MTDFDGSPETGWTGWQRIVVIVVGALIGVTAILLVIFVFTNDDEGVPDPSITATTVAPAVEEPSTSPPTAVSTDPSTAPSTTGATAVAPTSTTGA